MTVPIATSPGRSGFGPQLSLSYDSGSGNGPFGLGWGLSLPSITRKTDKGLPKYRDSEESDVFILSGAEDLVPVLKEQTGDWVRDCFERTVNNTVYSIQRYRPRIEGLFARIERWTSSEDPADTFWRSISKDNITTWYGKTSGSRIADPADSRRIFSWLICQSHDDKGNAIVYNYKQEDSVGVKTSCAHERNRADKTRAAQIYLKRIRYGNQVPYLPKLAPDSPWPVPLGNNEADGAKDWFFEVVFDYGDHDDHVPTSRDTGAWPVRNDPSSSYRAGFEVRTYRLCQRVLMFHHFPGEADVGADCLVRSTDFTYSYKENTEDVQNPIFSQILSIAAVGYKRQVAGGYLKKSLPPVEFTYTKVAIDETVRTVDPESLGNLPVGLDSALYQWVDLNGEGISGILTEQGGTWFYKRNLSPLPVRDDGAEPFKARFGPVAVVASRPALSLAGGHTQLMDLAGDGHLDLVQMEGPVRGFYERTDDANWAGFRPFKSWPNIDPRDPNLKFVDLTGDGHADILISEEGVFTWYESLGEEGFAQGERVQQSLDEEKGPRLVFADGTQSIYLADMSGDGLTDIVRIRNGAICYWPNLGHGRFGAKVTMDKAPWFDRLEQFDQRRVRLADIDGSGTTDIIYLGRDGVYLYFNQSGNSWSKPRRLRRFPPGDSLSTVAAVDLLGNGTACLVCSSALPAEARRPMCYIDLMGGTKPHLLIKAVNNLGAETQVRYASSTRFYLADERDGRPWITRLPFPVHVVEHVETFDHVSRNRFVTRYAYHHGYFDGEEREFRGFGMVEQWDTGEFATLSDSDALPVAANGDRASHVPPVYTKTWFHTGAFIEMPGISQQFVREYYSEGDPSENLIGLAGEQQRAQLLDDTLLPATVRRDDGTRLPYRLSADEAREACRALKGSLLRQEIYALDRRPDGALSELSDRPYSVSERNYTVELLQARRANRHAVFSPHAREQLDFHYERRLVEVNGTPRADPRVSHTQTLEVDALGNVLRLLAIGYRRRALPGVDAPEQQQTHLTLTVNRVANCCGEPDTYRVGLPVEARTCELVKPPEPSIVDTRVVPFGFERMRTLSEALFPLDRTEPEVSKRWPYEQWDWRTNDVHAPPDTRLRLIEHVRTLYRRDDLTGPLSLGQVESLALPYESYKLAFTPDLLALVYQRPRPSQSPENLLPSAVRVLEGKGPDLGGYVSLDGAWWIPSGQVFYDPTANYGAPALTAAQELTQARQHFFLPRVFCDPFTWATTVAYDPYDLSVVTTKDALNNAVEGLYDYRVLQPRRVTDPNHNRSEVAFDALGLVIATAVMGKETENQGDSLQGLAADLTRQQIDDFIAAPDPHTIAPLLLGSATTRVLYDVDRFRRTREASPDDPTRWAPVWTATLAREMHAADLAPGQLPAIQLSFSYSDGFGREIQKKIQAEPGPLVAGQAEVAPRWVGSGWTIFNNKGKPVRQYEPFFDDTHGFKFGKQVGVSPVLFYDPLDRVIVTLHPNDTYEKVVFDPWQQTTFDVNDTVASDPRIDGDTAGYVTQYFKTQRADWKTWLAQRHDGQMGTAEQEAAEKATHHVGTPTTAHLDSLGRSFRTVARNKVVCPGHNLDGTEDRWETCVKLDIEGNQREVTDAKGRAVMRYDYDLLSNRIHQASMEAGERWMLNDVLGKPIRGWDSRGFTQRMTYDELRRPTGLFVAENGVERLAEQTLYGEGRGDANNHRTRVYQICDGAGVVTSEAYDFKGNLLRSRRQLTQDYKTPPDWSQNPPPALEREVFTSSTRYDALHRPIQLVAPHSDQPNAPVDVIQPVYNEANLLERVDVWLGDTSEPDRPLDPSSATFHPVLNIDYNPKGQRSRIEYGNGAQTEHAYDQKTFRLIRLKTTCPAPTGLRSLVNRLIRPSASQGLPVCQDLSYTYDPAGNITTIRDDAQQTIFFKGQVVPPQCDYTYDALYRLIQATGREHIGQLAQPQTTWNDEFRVHLSHPQDGQAMRNYTEQYEYDAVGNFENMIHQAANGNWTRTYAYKEPSLLEPSRKSNRLSSTTVSGTTEPYTYDEHGNMTSLPHLTLMRWDCEDQLSATSGQVVNSGTPETTYYVYDAGGQRVRKVTDRQDGTRRNERLYLGGFEIYREYENDGRTAALERQTLHIMDDKQRIALVETRTLGSDGSPRQLIRYQLSNHLGSSALELDDQAQVISYEEYTPYGSTSYQAVDKSIVAIAKRYRYTGKERDEESGLYYYGARYCAAWLARWIACDPATTIDGTNLYSFTRDNPVALVDPTGLWTWRGVGRELKNAGLSGAGAVYGAGKTVVGGVVGIGKVTYYTTSKGLYEATGSDVWRDQARTYDQGIEAIAKTFEGGVVNAAKNYVQNKVERFERAADAGDHFGAGEVFGEAGMELFLAADAVSGATPNISISRAPALVTAGNGLVVPGISIAITGPSNLGGAMMMAGMTAEAATKERPSENVSGEVSSLRSPSQDIAKIIGREGGLTALANKLKGLGQGKGATVQIVLATTKDGKQILVAGINSGSKGLSPAQLQQLKEWGVNVAPELAKGMKGAPHAEENIAAYLSNIGARGNRWSRAVVGELKPSGSAYVCHSCQEIIKRIGGRVESSR